MKLLTADPLGLSSQVRLNAANTANAEDAGMWRWFSDMVEERRIRWCFAHDSWLVSVDHRHLATDRSFDQAIRVAKLCHQASADKGISRELSHRRVA
jgi:hypothetical protein